MTSTVVYSVLEALKDDLVSFGELSQLIDECVEKGSVNFKHVLPELLESGVEIGQAVNVDGEYVKFIAWNGNVPDRTKRAQDQIERVKKIDRDFSFWLCLSTNVDEYESDAP